MESYKKFLLTTFVFILLIGLVQSQLPKCFQDPFPKFMGAPNGKINFQSMDVSTATGAICVGGKTNDHSLKGSPPSSNFIPFIAYYEPENYSRKWVKYADIE